MTETELTREIQGLAHNLSRRTAMWQYLFRQNTPEALHAGIEYDAQIRRSQRPRVTGVSPDPALPPPITADDVRAAQEAVGFRFPPL
jgi:hypothetical protein